LLLIVLWFWLYILWKIRQEPLFGFVSLVFANLALYFKEPTCLFLAGFAVVQLLLFLKFDDERVNYFRRHWVDASLLASCLIFLGIYFTFNSVGIITSDAAYAGHGLKWHKGFASIVGWMKKEPLMIPLLVGGVAFSVYRGGLGEKRASITFGLWFGAFLYFLALTFSGLEGKFYGALPLLGFALHFYNESQYSVLRKPIRVLLWVPIVANVLLWGASVLYKYDWTNRYSEVVDQLSVLSEKEGQRQVLIEESGRWEIAMFIVYAERIRKLPVQFYCDYPNTVTWFSCPLNKSENPPTIRLSFGRGKNNAKLSIGEKEIWHYQSAWMRVPEGIRRLLDAHYDLW